MEKTAVVTGAASGLGLEFSKLLAGDSFNLILLDIDGPGLLRIKQDLEEKYSVSIDHIVCDLSKTDCINQLQAKVDHLQVDILINNAGYGLYGFFTTTDWQAEEAMINLHILNLTHLTKLILAQMTERRSGRIMNVCSVAAFQPGPLMAVYYATKAYILSFTEALSNEVKGTGVSVTALCPGLTKTKFQETVALRSGSKKPGSGYYCSNVETVAKSGYKAMMAGKSLEVPGLINKALVQAHRFVPRKFALYFVRKMQEKIRK